MSDTHRERADSANRPTRLACAADPEAPLSVLLDLAMEFPETVVTNTAFSVGLMSNPSALKDASPIALACLLTSPATTAELEALLMGLVKSAGLLSTDLRSYLDEWSSAGSRRVTVDVAVLADSCPDLEVDTERKVRGQCILARRLGWDNFGCPRGIWCDEYAGDNEPLYGSLLDGRVVQVASGLSLLNAFWNGERDRESGYDVQRDRVRVQEWYRIRLAHDVIVIAEGSSVPQPAKVSFENDFKEIALHSDVCVRFQALLAPWLKSSQLVADNRVLAVWCEGSEGTVRVATGTLDEVRKGLVATLEWADGELDPDEYSEYWDLEANPVVDFDHLLDEVVPVRGVELEDSGGLQLFAHLKRLPTGVKDLGGKRAITALCNELLTAALPAASATQYGTSSVPSATLVLLAGNGDVAVIFCCVDMSDAVIDASFQLDPMKASATAG